MPTKNQKRTAAKNKSAAKKKTAAPKDKGGAKKTSAGPLAVLPQKVFEAGAAMTVATHPDAAPYVLLFGAAGVVIAVATTLAVAAFKPAAQAFGQRLAERIEGANGDGTRLKKKIESSPNAQRALFDGARNLLESVAEECTAPLADLTAEYVDADRRPDGFFRGCCRVLRELTSEEFRTLVDMVLRLATEEVIAGRASLSFVYREAFDDQQRVGPRFLKYVKWAPGSATAGSPNGGEWTQQGTLDAGNDAHAYRVIQQLKLSGLADDPPSGGFRGVSGPEHFMMSAETLRRLGRLLGPQVV